MIGQNTPKMSHDEMIDTLKGLVFGTFDRTTAKERDALSMAIKELEQGQRWIPIKTRPLTEEEKEEYADLKYGDNPVNFMYDCPLPEDGEEVLVTTRYDDVTIDTFYRDDGCYFETYCDYDDAKAWMSLPQPYKAESEEI